MTQKVVVEKSGGIGLCSVLTLIFVTLKLAEIGEVATWSWWWVLSPLWLPLAVVLAIMSCGAFLLWLSDR